MNINIFSPLLTGKLGVDSQSSSLYYEDEQGMKFDLPLSSSMVGEVAGIMLPLLKMERGSLLIIEEHEDQLHLSTQLIMGFILRKIVQKTGIKLLLSTHSDILALILNYSTQKNLTKEKVSNFFEKVCKQKVNSDVIDLLSP